MNVKCYISKKSRTLLLSTGLLTIFLFSKLVALAQTNVTTYHYDNARTGQNTNETALTLSNVNSTQFGRLFSQPVDGAIYAQPLYIPNLNIVGGTHNVIFVTTENDSVYAFDADNNLGGNCSPLWHANLIDAAHGGGSNARAVITDKNGGADLLADNITPKIGITSTPVIDAVTNTMYVETFSKEGSLFTHRLHALDITTGNEKFGGPVLILPPTGITVVFNNNSTNGNQLNRPGLLLTGGTVYLAYSSDGADGTDGNYHGWVFAYNASNLSLIDAFVVTPNGLQPDAGGAGGIWMSGSGLAADASGNIFVATGNGTFDMPASSTGFPPNSDFGNSILKLKLMNGHFSVLDYFTPFDQASLNAGDFDLGSGGILLLPDSAGSVSHPHLLVQAGKGNNADIGFSSSASIHLLDRDQLTTGNQHYCNGCASDTPNILQEIPSAVGGMWSMPAYWNGRVYFWGTVDILRAFSISTGTLSTTPAFTGTETYRVPANISVSSSGSSNGILWTIQTDGILSSPLGPAILKAYNATNGTRIYSTDINSDRDNPGNAVRFAVPTVINGKVYVGTADRLSIYGLNPPPFARSCSTSLTSYTFSSADAEIVFLDSDQHVHQLAWNGSVWLKQNLTAMAGSNTLASPASGLTNYSLSTADVQVVYVGTNQHVYQLAWNGSIWMNQDLTVMAGSSILAAPGSAFTNFSLSHGSEQVVYQGANKHIYQLVWNGSAWINQDLKNLAGSSTLAALGSGLTSYSLSTADVQVVYLGTDQHVYQFAWNGSVWLNQDLTAMAGNGTPLADPQSVLTGFSLSRGTEQVVYQGADKHIYQLVWNGSAWINQDLKNLAGSSTLAALGSGLTSYSLSTADVQVVYLGIDQHVYQFAWNGSVWLNQDLTVMAGNGTPLADPQSAFTHFSLSRGSEQVVYQGVNQHIYQFVWNGVTWINQNLTAMAGGQ